MRPAKPSLALLVLLACAPLPLAASLHPSVAQAQAQAPAPAAAPAAAPLPPVDTVVAQVQNFYDQTRSFKSEFQQTFVVKAYNMTKHSHGQVTFLKPGKMDWSYDDPKDNRVVSDGTTLQVYEAANNQVYQQPVAGSQYPAALSFLTGQGQLSSSFDFEIKDGAGALQFPDGYVLVGTPKTPTAAYQKVLFYVDKQTFQIRRVLILDGQNNRNIFDFVTPQVNLPVNPNQFVFVPPPNTTVVHP
jgi:outer membrane lipoprotein carrier protein